MAYHMTKVLCILISNICFDSAFHHIHTLAIRRKGNFALFAEDKQYPPPTVMPAPMINSIGNFFENKTDDMSFIQCYMTSMCKINGHQYGVGFPVDMPVMLTYFEGNELKPIRPDYPDYDHLVNHVSVQMDYNDFQLYKTPVVLTLQGEFEEEDMNDILPSKEKRIKKWEEEIDETEEEEEWEEISVEELIRLEGIDEEEDEEDYEDDEDEDDEEEERERGEEREREKRDEKQYCDGAVVIDPKNNQVVTTSARSLSLFHSRHGSLSLSLSHPLLSPSLLCIEAVAHITREREKEREEGYIDQYLCTGLIILLYQEPDILSAMSLLHSRISQVIYVERERERGMLGSKMCLHEIKSLNHHFRVFHLILNSDEKERKRERERKIEI